MIKENNFSTISSLPLKKVPLSNMTRGLTTGSILKCIDGSGVVLVEIIGVLHRGNTAKRNISAGVGHIIRVAVKRGTNKGKMELALITTTKRKFYRASQGVRVMFQKNTCVLVEKSKKLYQLKNNNIKYPVAKECLQTVPAIRKYVTVC